MNETPTITRADSTTAPASKPAPASTPASEPRSAEGMTREEEAKFWETGELPKRESADKDGAPKEKKVDGSKSEAKPGVGKDGKPAEADDKQSDQRQQPKTPQQAVYEARDRLFERAAKEPDFEKFVDNWHQPVFQKSAEGNARFQGMAQAIMEISNAEEVIYFLAQPANSSVVFGMQSASPEKVYQAVHRISAELRFGMKRGETAPKPKPPKPPAEVGGRGTAPDNPGMSAAREGNFKSFDAAMKSRYSKR